MANSKSMIGLRVGILIGILSMALNYAANVCLHQGAIVWFGVCIALLMVITPVFYGITGMRYAARAGRAVTFRDIFSVLLIAIFVSTAISFLWSLIYLKFIDPGISMAYRHAKLEYMKMMNAKPDVILKETEQMASGENGHVTAMSQLIFFGELILAKAVVAAITTLLLLRAPATRTS